MSRSSSPLKRRLMKDSIPKCLFPNRMNTLKNTGQILFTSGDKVQQSLVRFSKHFKTVECFLLGNSRVYGFYMPTFRSNLPMKMEQTNCSETWSYKIQTPGDSPEESLQNTAKV